MDITDIFLKEYQVIGEDMRHLDKLYYTALSIFIPVASTLIGYGVIKDMHTLTLLGVIMISIPISQIPLLRKLKEIGAGRLLVIEEAVGGKKVENMTALQYATEYYNRLLTKTEIKIPKTNLKFHIPFNNVDIMLYIPLFALIMLNIIIFSALYHFGCLNNITISMLSYVIVDFILVFCFQKCISIMIPTKHDLSQRTPKT